MVASHNNEIYRETPSYRLLTDAYRQPVEQIVSQYYQSKWRVIDFKDMNDYASHPSAILSDGVHPVFVKLSLAKHGYDQFEVELMGLNWLSTQAGVLTPTPLGIVHVNNGVILVLEAAEVIERTPSAWREIGRTLAHIHQVKGDRFGFHMQGYFGSLFQDNRTTEDWLTFYIERRLWPRLMGAIDSGFMPTSIIKQVEHFITRLSGLGLPECQPVLLHGDAQQNNYISTPNGAMVIDPAIYYGNPEVDLAYLDYFQPVPNEVFEGYQDILPIDPGFPGRRDLWRVAAYLAAVQAGGEDYLAPLVEAIRRYL